jgi:hypothetical protein
MSDTPVDPVEAAVSVALSEFGADLAKSGINTFDLTNDSICRSIAKVAVSAFRGHEHAVKLDEMKAFLAETDEEFDEALRGAQKFLGAWRQVVGNE